MSAVEPLAGVVPVRPKRLALAVSAAAAFGGAQGAQAALEIEEIIVTATKRAESLQEVAQAVQAFSTEDIRRQRFVGIDDYAKKLPALSFANREPGGLSVVFRGVSVSGLSFGENASSSVYLDEQPITSSGRNPNPRLTDIERLEALSGPQGTLFGDSSQSGALRIITNKPDATATEGWVDGTVHGYEEGDTGGDLSGMLNLPLVKDKLALRLVGFTAHEAGFIDNVEHKSPGRTYTNADIAESNVNSADSYGGRAALRWYINEEWTADATGLFEHREADGFSDVDVELDDLDQRRFERDSLEDEWYQMALTLEGPVLGLDSTIAVSYFDRDFRYEADATDYEFSLQRNSCGPRYPGTCDNNSPDFYTDFYDFGGDPRGQAGTHDQEDRWSVEARLVTPGDSTSRWSGVAGLFYNKSSGETLFRSRARNFGDSDFFDYLNYLAYLGNGSYKDPTDTWWMGGYDTELEQSAVFGEVTYAITERISITGGGRWYDVEDSFLLINGALQEGWPDPAEEPIWTNVQVDSDESGEVWKLSLKWQIDDDRMVYATYSEGFRSGGGNPIRRDSKLPTSFESDFLYNYEVGLKSTWMDGRVLFNTTAYHMDWLDIQVQVEDPRPAVYALAFVNFPEASIDGIETQLQWVITENWQLSGSLAKIDAEISKTATLFPRSNYPITVIDGTPLPLAPDYKGAITLEYAPPVSLFGGEPFVQLDYSYQGESYNSIGSEAVIAENPPARHDNYATLDFSMGVEAEGWSATLFVDNLTDERGEQFFNNRWGKQRLSVNDPRAMGLTVRKNF